MPLQMALRCTSACTSRTGARKAVLRWAAGERNRPRELRSWKLKHRKQRDVSTVTLEYSDRDADGRIQENIVYLPPHKEQAQEISHDAIAWVAAFFVLLWLFAPEEGAEQKEMLHCHMLFAVAAFPYAWVAIITCCPQILKKSEDSSKMMGATMLVAGGTVGAGIVALPVKTAHVGFLPSAVCLIGGWGFMLLSAMLIVAVSQHCKRGANFTSMAEQILGWKWKATVAVLYIFVYSATLTAYIAESATFLSPLVPQLLGMTPHRAILAICFTIICGFVVGMGSKAVDTANSACMLVALAAFAIVLCFGSSAISASALAARNWSSATQTIPIMIVAFTFHNMIPSLLSYLNSAALVRKALILGTAIPLAMYLVWEMMILGSLPPGSSVASVADVMKTVGASKLVTWALNIFSLFAIVTSFLGVALGCVDFLNDLLGQSTGAECNLTLLLASLGAPLAVACICPKLFVPALEILGMVSLILFSVIPALMVRKGPLARERWKGDLVVLVFSVVSIAIIGLDVRGRFLTSL